MFLLQPAGAESPMSGLLRCGRRFACTLVFSALLLALPGCQSVIGTPVSSQVRLLNASPDASALDAYQGSAVLAYNLGLGTITSYVSVTPGTSNILANQAGTHTQLITATGTFAADAQYTILIGNYLDALQEVILKDQSTASPPGQVNLRFVDQSVRAGALDLYLVPTGSTVVTQKPLAAGVSFNGNTGYLSVAAGTYTLVALPAGATPTASGSTSYTGAAVAYVTGSASTIVLIDPQPTSTPGVQIVTAADYQPPAAG